MIKIEERKGELRGVRDRTRRMRRWRRTERVALLG